MDSATGGYVYVADRDNNAVKIYNKQGKKVKDVLKTPAGLCRIGFKKKVRTRCKARCFLLVRASAHTFARIYCMSCDLRTKRRLRRVMCLCKKKWLGGGFAGALQKPYGIAVDCASDGLVYVSENNYNRITVLKKDGTYLGAIGAAGLGPGKGSTCHLILCNEHFTHSSLPSVIGSVRCIVHVLAVEPKFSI